MVDRLARAASLLRARAPRARRPGDERGRVVFDHLPKSGGTSIRAALEQSFGPAPEVQLSQPHHALPFDGGHALLAGHLWFYAGEPLRDGWLYATLVRDPVDRFLSQYFFNRSDQIAPGTERDPQVVAARRLTLEEFVETDDEALRATMVNVQLQHFASRVVSEPARLPPSELFDAATTSIWEYDVVATFDQLGPFVTHLCRVAHRPPPTAIPVLNQGRRGAVSAATRERLAALNEAEIRFVQWVARRGAELRRGAPVARRAASTTGEAVEFGTREVEVVSVAADGAPLHGPSSDPASATRAPQRAAQPSGPPSSLTVDLVARRPVEGLTIGVELAGDGSVVGTNTRHLGLSLSVAEPGPFSVTFDWPDPFPPGTYALTVAAHRGYSHTEGCFHWISRAAHLRVDQVGRPGEVGGQPLGEPRVSCHGATVTVQEVAEPGPDGPAPA